MDFSLILFLFRAFFFPKIKKKKKKKEEEDMNQILGRNTKNINMFFRKKRLE